MKVKIDDVKCCGAGLCVMQAPEVFDQGEEDGIVRLLEANPSEDLHEKVQMAVLLCPSLAITVSDERPPPSKSQV